MTILAIGKYLYAVIDPASESRRTQVWAIRSVRNGDVLGWVKWFGRWRQYAFFPEPDTIFNAFCLTDLFGFITDRMSERRKPVTR